MRLKNIFGLTAGLSLALVIQTSNVLATEHFEIRRCGDDQLGAEAAKTRLEWGMKCSSTVYELVTDWKYYAINSDIYNPIEDVPTDGAADETTPRKRKHSRPEDVVFQVIFEGKLNLGYPSFGYMNQKQKNKDRDIVPMMWRAPITSNASCERPADVDFRHMCPAGCYTNDQVIWFEDGPEYIGALKNNESRKLMTLDADSTIENLKFSPRELLAVVSDPVATIQSVYILDMASGGQLKVTPNHPLIDGNGLMRRADSLSAGHQLVTANGELDKIISIKKGELKMRAYNVVTGTFDKMEKIIVAQGYLSGDLYYQNAGVDFINRMIIRKAGWLNEGRL